MAAVETREIVLKVRGSREVVNAFRALTREADATSEEIGGVGKAGGRAGREVSRGARQAEGAVHQLGQAARTTGQAIKTHLVDQTKRGFASLRGAAASLVKGLIAAGATMAAVGTTAAIRITAQRDAVRRGLSAQIGPDQAGAVLEDLRTRISRKPGVTYDSGAKLIGDLVAVRMDATLAARAVEEFGNALALAGRGEQELERVGVALSQIVSKGVVSAEEINQLAEAVPQIRDVLQNTFGTADTEALTQMLETYGISVKEFVELLVDGFSQLERADPNSLANMLTNLGAAGRDLLAAFGGGFAGPQGQGGIAALTQLLEKATPPAAKLGQLLAAQIPVLTRWIEKFDIEDGAQKAIDWIAKLIDWIATVGDRAEAWTALWQSRLKIIADGTAVMLGELGNVLDAWSKMWLDRWDIMGEKLRIWWARLWANIRAEAADALADLLDMLQIDFKIELFGREFEVELGLANGALENMATSLRNTAQQARNDLRGLARASEYAEARYSRSARGFDAALQQMRRSFEQLRQQWEAANREYETTVQQIERARAEYKRLAAAGLDTAAAEMAVTDALEAQNDARLKLLDLMARQRAEQEKLIRQTVQAKDRYVEQQMAAERAQIARAERDMGPITRRRWSQDLARAERDIQREIAASRTPMAMPEYQVAVRRRAAEYFGQREFEAPGIDRKIRENQAAIEYYERLAERSTGVEKKRLENWIAERERYGARLQAERDAHEAAAQRQVQKILAATEAEAALQDMRIEGARKLQSFWGRGLVEIGQDALKQLATIGQLRRTAGGIADPERRAAVDQERMRIEADLRQMGVLDDVGRLTPDIMAAIDAVRRSAAADPRRISVSLSGASERQREMSRQDRITAGILGNPGAGIQSILAEARMRQDREVIRGAVVDAGQGIARVVSEALRELPELVRRNVQTAQRRAATAAP